MKVLDNNVSFKYIFLLCIVISASCVRSSKGNKANFEKPSLNHASDTIYKSNTECLTANDTDEIDEYINNFSKVILEKDKNKYTRYIHFPLDIENNIKLTKQEFFKILATNENDSFKSSIVINISYYISNKLIDRMELDEMKESKTFKKDCSYSFTKTFPKDEFSISFELKRFDKQIKLSKLRVAG